MPDSVTQILASGPPGAKKNIAVLGDGFAAGDQTAYNTKVQELLLDGVFGRDYFYEDKSAYNIYRVNLISAQSGVSTRVYDEHGTPTDPSDDTITSTTIRNTALGYIFSGSWAHCWLEGGASTSTKVQNALNAWVPDYDLVVIILNNPGFGGCGGGGFQIVTMGASWSVMAHEFGHGTGGLADEYCANPGTFTGGEPGVAEHHDQHQPRDAQVAAVRERRHTGSDRRRSRARATPPRPSRPAGATATTPASSRAAARGRAGSTARRSTAGCAATRRRTARSVTRG